jgi:hypothetical protein
MVRRSRTDARRLVDDLRTWALNTNKYFKVPDFVHEGMVPEPAAAA